MPFDASDIENVRQAGENRLKAQEEAALNLTEYFQKYFQQQVENNAQTTGITDTIPQIASGLGALTQKIREKNQSETVPKIEEIKKSIENRNQEISELLIISDSLLKKLQQDSVSLEAIMKYAGPKYDDPDDGLKQIWDPDDPVGWKPPMTWEQKQREKKYLQDTIAEIANLITEIEELIEQLKKLQE